MLHIHLVFWINLYGDIFAGMPLYNEKAIQKERRRNEKMAERERGKDRGRKISVYILSFGFPSVAFTLLPSVALSSVVDGASSVVVGVSSVVVGVSSVGLCK